MKKLIGLIVVVFVTAGSASADLIVGYDFETVNGTSVNDLSANNLDGTLVDNATTVADATRGINVLSLDGINDWVDAGNNDQYNTTGDMTVMAWVNMKDKSGLEGGVNYSWQTAFAKGDANSWRLQHAPNFGFTAWQWPLDPGIGNSNAQIGSLLGGWHHLAGVKSGDTYTTYVDGNARASDTQAATPKTGDANLLIGANPELGAIPANDDPSRELFGLVDDFAFFNTALSEAEIQEVMNNGIIPEPAALSLISLGLLCCLGSCGRRRSKS